MKGIKYQNTLLFFTVFEHIHLPLPFLLDKNSSKELSWPITYFLLMLGYSVQVCYVI